MDLSIIAAAAAWNSVFPLLNLFSKSNWNYASHQNWHSSVHSRVVKSMVHKTRNADMILNIVLCRVCVKHRVDTKYQSSHSSGKPNNESTLMLKCNSAKILCRASLIQFSLIQDLISSLCLISFVLWLDQYFDRSTFWIFEKILSHHSGLYLNIWIFQKIFNHHSGLYLPPRWKVRCNRPRLKNDGSLRY